MVEKDPLLLYFWYYYSTVSSDILPFPKAQPRKKARQGRKKFSTVLTNTPNRNKIAMAKALREAKKPMVSKSKAKRNIFPNNSSDSEMDIEDACFSNGMEAEDDISSNSTTDAFVTLSIISTVDIDDFVLCEYTKKKSVNYYIGQVFQTLDEDFEIQVTFLKRAKQEEYFIFSEEQASISIDNIKAILPKPIPMGSTLRTRGILKFPINFGDLHVL